LFGELVAGAGFEVDRLYVEWRVTYDPAIWLLQGPTEACDADRPGVLQVSPVAKQCRTFEVVLDVQIASGEGSKS
jgi:hypothetical protein